MAPSTFASAAAGNNQNPNSTREASFDWSRRANGATQTFRRPSVPANMPSSTQHSDALSQQPPRYVPPHRNGTYSDTRYSRDQLFDLFKAQHSSEGGLKNGLSDLVIGAWQLELANGTSAGWGRTENNRDAQSGPDICWDRDGSMEPLGLNEMDDDERELFSTTVNTPIKPPSTANKENQSANGMSGRKGSISNSTSGSAYGVSSPGMIRGSGRRREASESFSSSQNPIGSPGSFSRDDQRAASPPLSLLRRRTDLKQLQIPEDRDKEADEKTANPLGTLKRHPTGPFSALGVSSAPWSTAPQSAGLSPMGSFGNFGLTGQQGGTGERRPGLTSGRSESRFKNLLTKEGGEDGGERGMERKTSTSNLSRVNELESWRPQERSDAMNDLDETDEELPTGSAALAGDTETSPPHTKQTHGVFGTPSRQGPSDEYGFGAFGMTSDTPHGFGQNFLAGRDVFNQASNQQRMSMSMGGNNEPMSPTDTNPYQSPEQHGIDRMAENFDDGSDLHGAHLPGLGGFGADSGHQLAGLGGFGGLPNLGRAPGMPGQAGDRSQTSSAGQTRVFSLGGMGQLAGASGSMAWPASPGGLGTPGRQGSALPNAFGGGIFGPGDMQSPGLGGLGGNNPFGSHPSGFGGGRMGSMFPSGMHEQMRQLDQRQDDRDTNNDKASMGDMSRSSDSPFKGQAFNDGQSIQHQSEQAREGQQGQFGNLAPPGGVSDQGQPGQPGSSASNQPPPPQQRTMVMPDRMRWIYRDPQGQTQGPWSGLEMHDWYKAGFFSPELLVKKYEDPDYEPLAQLIRRIGNSREPFLVPQIGIPHGPPSNNGPNSWAGSGPISTSGPSGGAQPPFASSFPSFGTTLTADQQNALERRKQEEQYLMARQKEHLAQAQFAQRMQMQTGQHQGFMPGQLHHHSSAHSLQSQPSFGSIKSPTAYQPSPVHGAAPDSSAGHVSGFFDNSFRSAPAPGVGAVGAGVDTLGHIREEEMPGLVDRLDIGGNQTGPGQFGGSGQTFAAHELAQQANQDSRNPQVQQMLQDRARLQQEQAQRDATQQSEDGSRATSQRLQQFQQLQGQMNDRFQPAMEASQESSRQSSVSQQGQPQVQETLSLTEQVQKAASAKQSPTPEHPGLPHPFPPAPSQSPLPAPAAQRTGRQSVADQLQTESRDLSQTPSTDTPSAAVAPWAKEPAEAPRGPSLKEIQEAEAKKAAELEEMAAAARRAAFQKEMEAQSMSTAVQPGLPAAATWATGSPITPTGSAAAAWTKTTQKSNGPTGAKSMAQIQKEEEARKKKLAAAALTAQANAMSAAVASSAGGKSYANLAGKVSTSQTSTSASDRAWTTVGASGKTKTPVTVAAPSPTSRTVSTGTVPTLPSTNAPARKAPTRSSTMTNSAAVNAQEEFKKWAVNELRPDLNKGISVEDFVASLVFLPPETEIITEAVHGVSSTIDSRHFAEEFIRRKRLADKGMVDTSMPPKSTSPYSANDNKSGGWSEVAKKGPSKESAKEDTNGHFRVVAAKKKGVKK